MTHGWYCAWKLLPVISSIKASHWCHLPPSIPNFPPTKLTNVLEIWARQLKALLPPGIYSASESLLSPPLTKAVLPKSTTVSLWVNPPLYSLHSCQHWQHFSSQNCIALASPVPSCLPVTTHLSGTPHFLSFSSALRVLHFLYVLWTFYFSIYIFFPWVVSNTPITLITICMLTAFKSVSSPAFSPQLWT